MRSAVSLTNPINNLTRGVVDFTRAETIRALHESFQHAATACEIIRKTLKLSPIHSRACVRIGDYFFKII